MKADESEMRKTRRVKGKKCGDFLPATVFIICLVRQSRRYLKVMSRNGDVGAIGRQVPF